MCSPDQLEKLLNDDKLFKQYVILCLSNLNSKIEEHNSFEKRLSELENRLDTVEKSVIKMRDDITLIKKVIVGVGGIITAIVTSIAGNLLR